MLLQYLLTKGIQEDEGPSSAAFRPVRTSQSFAASRTSPPHASQGKSTSTAALASGDDHALLLALGLRRDAQALLETHVIIVFEALDFSPQS